MLNTCVVSVDTATPAPLGLELPPKLAAFASDREFVRDLVAIFREESLPLLGEIGDCLARGNAEGVRVAAHTLAGALSYFTAGAAHDAAIRLELLGRTKKLEGAAAVHAELEEAVARLHPLLSALAHG